MYIDRRKLKMHKHEVRRGLKTGAVTLLSDT